MRCRASLFNALHGDGLGPTSLRSSSRLRVWPSWDGQSLIVLADLNAIMCLMSAADDLNLLGTGLRDRTSSLATAARGALEAASYAAFLAGPGISPAERARRSLNEVLHSTHENVLTYRMVAPEQVAEEENYRDGLIEAGKKRSEFGPFHKGDDIRTPRFGEKPKITDMVEPLLKTQRGDNLGLLSYKGLSTSVHARWNGWVVAGIATNLPDGEMVWPMTAGHPGTWRAFTTRHSSPRTTRPCACSSGWDGTRRHFALTGWGICRFGIASASRTPTTPGHPDPA